MINKLCKFLLPLKRYIQEKACTLAALSISKWGYYPSILDHLISRNNFGIDKFKIYNADKVNVQVQKILSRLDSIQSDISPVNDYSLVSSSKPLKKLAFLTTGRAEAITNKVLSDIGHSYGGKVIFVNQKFDGANSFSKADMAENFGLLVDFAPDIVFFELHTLMNSDSDFTIFSKAFILRLKEELGTKVCVICFDIWREFDLSYLEYWSDLVDIFTHIDQKAASKIDNIYPMFFWPYPALNSRLRVNAEKDYGIFFQGSVREYDRRKLLSHVARLASKYQIDFTFNIFSHHTKRNIPSQAQYLNELSRAKYCIGLSQKNRDHWLITFRSIEAIDSGATLIQQTGLGFDPLSTLYKPFEHYLPFSTDLELQAILFIIKHHSDRLDFISENAYIYHSLHYSKQQLWNALIDEIFEI